LAIEAAVLLLLPACRSRSLPPPRNAVLIVVDTLRADHLGCYGYQRPASPNIDKLAASGTRFVNGISSTPWTLPSMATIMTGLYPSVHGVVRASNVRGCRASPANCQPVNVLDPSRTTLAEVLQRHGFQTAAFVPGNGYTNPLFGLGQGFDHYATVRRSARLMVEGLADWLDLARPQRFFAYLHLIEVHAPYAAPDASHYRTDGPEPVQRARAAMHSEEVRRYDQFNFDPDYRGQMDGSVRALKAFDQHDGRDLEHLIALYDQGIAYTDYWIGQLIALLAQRGLTDSTIVLLTADHGEELMDHGGLTHAATFYEEMMRVPFIIRVPHEGIGRVVDEQVGLIDVLPTLVDLLAVDEALAVQGRSIRPLLSGGSLPQRTLFGEAAMISPMESSRTNRWKYIEADAGPRLYDLQTDAGEKTNLCEADRDRCQPFAKQLREWRAAMQVARSQGALPTPPAAAIDEQTREHLRALGYEE
jgi:arylsulfatase A-like enzyme